MQGSKSSSIYRSRIKSDTGSGAGADTDAGAKKCFLYKGHHWKDEDTVCMCDIFCCSAWSCTGSGIDT